MKCTWYSGKQETKYFVKTLEDVSVTEKERDKNQNHSLTINAVEDRVSGTSFMR